MLLSSSQQVVVAFTVVLCSVVLLPRMPGVGSGPTGRDTRGFDPRHHRKGGDLKAVFVAAGPTGVRGQAASQRVENVQQMKTMVEQEMKSEQFKGSGNKGYVFTLMPLYTVAVGLFASYKFLKMKTADQPLTEKDKVEKGARNTSESEKQLNELEQRLVQTERMLNSILGQLDPLTNCVKSVAEDQKTEVLVQLQTIRSLMHKRGMEVPPSDSREGSSQANLDKLIESLAACKATPTEEAPPTSDKLIRREQADDFQGAEQNRRREEEEAPPTLQEPWMRDVENRRPVCEELPVSEEELPVSEEELPVSEEELPVSEEELPVCEELPASVRRRHPHPE
ncbi:hypothetical protein NHX12_020609 [Muraenolepis orangiensis]|uniref:Resistance to inhibitors of cholinesterase protein 3 N-terminal domain-containing protein n=1 Tax=Muraenolepis orangiensis TaxID=630683 RepID=A0A9Q0EVL9_9TELE|nr:hypothetical protein NHX12_020609 [Muraenolepis orangiensis]